MKKAMFIRGPVHSYGRSGLSWGAVVPTEWDVVSWDATRDIEFNVREATALGFSCFFIHWENDDPAKNLNIRELKLVPIKDPFPSAYARSGFKNDEMQIQKSNPYVKNSTYNDQRQALASQFGFHYLNKLDFDISISVRTDQRMNWRKLSADLLDAYNLKRILFPAQKNLTSLDSGYTGFSIIDFFYGGDTKKLMDWFDHVKSGGRLYGPHQDVAWKPLIHNARWKEFFPGLTILSDSNNQEKQLAMARVFWQEFAYPSSKKTMSEIIWRGSQLGVIDYKVSAGNEFAIDVLSMEPPGGTKSTYSQSAEHFEWDLLTSYITGKPTSNNLDRKINTEIFLDHLSFVINCGKFKNRYLILRILRIILLGKINGLLGKLLRFRS